MTNILVALKVLQWRVMFALTTPDLFMNIVAMTMFVQVLRPRVQAGIVMVVMVAFVGVVILAVVVTAAGCFLNLVN